ncbi:carboxypeptidase-like regulatory domain-containing protein [Lacipirellula parvula]|uniref:Uncharacterized protein n=1 Tax=Lacipirellula parvula TaxID=2650471 RepID=A0A5K7X8W9_9BACT|nr:carboxypeptidase-like regulatory domain-containing protein [Lacipirellula parvula]BBO33224.1 hypothetical protein PLANPX_2836 [Lacipirellula parvula]
MLARWLCGAGVLVMLLCGVAISAESPSKAGGATVDERDPDDPRFAGNFRGVVNGPDGQPFAGARVYLMPYDEALAPYDQTLKPEVAGLGPVRAVTDEAGRFEFEAPDATFVDLDSLPSRRNGLLIVTADGYGADFRNYRGRIDSALPTAAERIERNYFAFQLAADDVPIRGRLLGTHGQPLVGARVRLGSVTIPPERDLDAKIAQMRKASVFHSPPFPGQVMYRPDLLPGVTAEARTDNDGEFELSGIGADRLVRLEITGAGVVTTQMAVMTREGDDVGTMLDPDSRPTQLVSAARFTRICEPGRTITGRVIDRETRQPIAGMRVGKSLGRPRDGVGYGVVLTDADGKFQLAGLTPSSDEVCITAASSPGMAYESGEATAKDDGPVEIECRRGIPFRLKLVDELGKPVEARVTYADVGRNPLAQSPSCNPCRQPYSVAIRDATGSYRGFVEAGPGAILVEATDGVAYHATDVKPSEFFAAELAKLSPKWQIEAFGTSRVLYSSIGGLDLDSYPAMVLVNPEVDSPPLELTATVVCDVPQRVELVDGDGRLVEGCRTQGMTQHLYDAETRPRGGAFGIRGLHAERARRITFFHEDRKLIGFVLARAGVKEVIRLRMEPWGTITGRLLDEAGKPLARQGILAGSALGELNLDPKIGERGYVHTDDAGRFQIDELVPGQRYDGRFYREPGKPEQTVFEGVTLKPGETIDLGDVQLRPIGVARVRTHGAQAPAVLLAARAHRSE